MSLFRTNFTVEKSIEINAPKEKVWEFITVGEKKTIWSPWVILERTCDHEFEGNPGEVGYKEAWSGKVIGEGFQEIQESEKFVFTKSKLDFIKPFKSTSYTEFRLEEVESGTKVIWKMNGSLPFFMFFIKKVMKFFIGNDFKRGLLMLKVLIETGELKTKTEFNGKVTVNRKYYINKKGSGTLAEIAQKMSNDFLELSSYVSEKKLKSDSYFTIYDKADLMNNDFSYKSCVEITGEDYTNFILDGDFHMELGAVNHGEFTKTTHYGSYDYLGNSWTGAFMYSKAENIKVNDKSGSIELYKVGPQETNNPDEYITEILLEVK